MSDLVDTRVLGAAVLGGAVGYLAAKYTSRPTNYEVVSTSEAPGAIGPYSQAIKSGGTLYMSGQIGMDKDGNLVDGGHIEQAQQVFRNIDAVLKAAGRTKTDVCKVSVFLSDLGNFAEVNKEYVAYFGDHKPARDCVQVAALPKGAQVEVTCTAAL